MGKHMNQRSRLKKTNTFYYLSASQTCTNSHKISIKHVEVCARSVTKYNKSLRGMNTFARHHEMKRRKGAKCNFHSVNVSGRKYRDFLKQVEGGAPGQGRLEKARR